MAMSISLLSCESRNERQGCCKTFKIQYSQTWFGYSGEQLCEFGEWLNVSI